MFLNYWEDAFPIAQAWEQMMKEGRSAAGKGIPLENVRVNCTDTFSYFLQGWLCFSPTCGRSKKKPKVDMIPEFDQYPIFYFTNHHSIQGPGEIYCMPDHFEKLGF